MYKQQQQYYISHQKKSINLAKIINYVHSYGYLSKLNLLEGSSSNNHIQVHKSIVEFSYVHIIMVLHQKQYYRGNEHLHTLLDHKPNQSPKWFTSNIMQASNQMSLLIKQETQTSSNYKLTLVHLKSAEDNLWNSIKSVKANMKETLFTILHSVTTLKSTRHQQICFNSTYCPFSRKHCHH